MRLPPDEIRILGKNWSVVRKDGLIEDAEAVGQTYILEQKILYSADCTPSQCRDTILHEVFHAIDLTLGLNLTEEQVHAMAAGLYAVIEDNPTFRGWLLDRPAPKHDPMF